MNIIGLKNLQFDFICNNSSFFIFTTLLFNPFKENDLLFTEKLIFVVRGFTKNNSTLSKSIKEF